MKKPASEPTSPQQPPDRRSGSAEGETAVLANIAAMPEPDRAIGERLHAIIKASAPSLSPRLWYGMPAYARDGEVVCFFQSAQKFKTRYMTLGFSDKANLDEGAMWPTAFALKESDCRRRGTDRGARQESGELKSSVHPHLAGISELEGSRQRLCAHDFFSPPEKQHHPPRMEPDRAKIHRSPCQRIARSPARKAGSAPVNVIRGSSACMRSCSSVRHSPSRPDSARNPERRSAISMLLRSEKGKCVLPWMPIPGREMMRAWPPCLLTVSTKSRVMAR